ncbi:MAG: ferredoxin [Acidimicrobiia bacterium]
MRVEIDYDRCTGHGRCYSLEPSLFVDDESGYGRVIGDGTVGPDHVDAARRAVTACPERAIILHD